MGCKASSWEPKPGACMPAPSLHSFRSPHPPHPPPPPPPNPRRAGAASLRSRLHQLLTPLLRLVLAVVTALPGSSAVREQALGFMDAHARTLTRVLHDAASPGIRWVGWGWGCGMRCRAG